MKLVIAFCLLLALVSAGSGSKKEPSQDPATGEVSREEIDMSHETISDKNRNKGRDYHFDGRISREVLT